MGLHVFKSAEEANARAAEMLIAWMTARGFRNLMVAAGNTPLDMYRRVGAARPRLPELEVFALDEYVGVPLEEPRNCANLMRRSVAETGPRAKERGRGAHCDRQGSLSCQYFGSRSGSESGERVGADRIGS